MQVTCFRWIYPPLLLRLPLAICLLHPSLFLLDFPLHWLCLKHLWDEICTVCHIMSSCRETDVKWDKDGKWDGVRWERVRAERRRANKRWAGETEVEGGGGGTDRDGDDTEINKKTSGQTGGSRPPLLSHAALWSLTALPETSVQSSYTQLWNDMRVHLCVCAGAAVHSNQRDLTLSPPLRDPPPPPPPPSYYSLIPSAVPPSGPVTDTSQYIYIYIYMCVCVCVIACLQPHFSHSQKEELAGLCYPLLP